jgi:hypothetical protein
MRHRQVRRWIPKMSLAPNPVRQDLIRGLRLGAILLIAALLVIAGYRMWGGSPAAAREPEPPSVPVAPPAPEPVAPQEAAIEISAPPPAVVEEPRKWVPKTQSPKTPKPEKFVAPKRVVPTAPVLRPVEVTAVAVPEVSAAPPSVNLTAPATVTPPPPEEGPGIGSKTRGVVRSVGRIFGIGRKNDKSAPAEGKQP